MKNKITRTEGKTKYKLKCMLNYRPNTNWYLISNGK